MRPGKVRYWILRDRKPIPATIYEWGKFMEELPRRRVAETRIGQDVSVSTVFLGIDPSWNPTAEPQVFETMIFGGPLDQYSFSFATWEQAEIGHDEAVRLARKARWSPIARLRAWIRSRRRRR